MHKLIFALLSISLIAGCTQLSPANYDLSGKTVAIYIAQNNFNDQEYSVLRSYLESSGAEIKVAGELREEATGMQGTKVLPDYTYSEIRDLVAGYDAVVIVGGSGTSSMSGNPDIMRALEYAEMNHLILAGICLGPTILAEAGMLEGQNATVFPDSQAIAVLQDNGANYIEQPVVVAEGYLVTAGRPEHSQAFAEKIAELLSG